MAKTLFFIEALVLAAMSLIFPIIASEATVAFIIPAVVSLILPLACAAAVWPLPSVFRSIGLAFSPSPPGSMDAEAASILYSLGRFSREAAVLGFLLSLAAICQRLPLASGLNVGTMLGIYLSLYALVNAVLWRILAAVLRRLPRLAEDDRLGGEAIAAQYGLTPREWETASLIAAGFSYKETAHELGISIKTVKTHMGRVYEKTSCGSNVGLALLFRAESRDPTKVR